MKAWYTKNLGDAMLAMGPLDHIEELFHTEYLNSGSPMNMALFMRHEMHGDLHCELIVYLSPAAYAVGDAVGAVLCDRPSPEGLSLLGGNENSWQLYFPERTS